MEQAGQNKIDDDAHEAGAIAAGAIASGGGATMKEEQMILFARALSRCNLSEKEQEVLISGSDDLIRTSRCF